MKKSNIYTHELNESMQADAAISCLTNRNKQQQMNEALPLVAGAIRLAMPLLRPLITKIVKSLVMKAGAKLTGRQVAKMVIKNVANGKTLMKVGKKVGQTWTKIPTELKQEIAKTAINTFKEMRQPKQEVATQEQEETSDFDARFKFRKDLRELASPAAKKVYMILRKKYGDGLERQLYMSGASDDEIMAVIETYAERSKSIDDCIAKLMGQKSIKEEEETTSPWIGRQYNGGIDFDADGNLQVITPDYDDEDDDYEAPPLFDSEQERHDVALACTYCLGESFIDNDGDLDDIYYAVLNVFDSTYDAPADPDDYKEVLQWCRRHYQEIEQMIVNQ